MSIRCLIYPQSTATPGELMDLAAALERWRKQERAACGVAPDLTAEGMSDLKNGLFPAAVDGAEAERPAIQATVSSDLYSDDLLVQTLGRAVPAHLVEEIELA